MGPVEREVGDVVAGLGKALGRQAADTGAGAGDEDRFLCGGFSGCGLAMVVGGGIAGMQASLDLADSGYKVYLLEKTPAIGGVMAQLDKTFPTNDCSM